MEHRYAGPRGISILGLNTGTIDLSVNGWGHQAGLAGERNQVYTEEGSKKVKWNSVSKAGPPLSWYKVMPKSKTKPEEPVHETVLSSIFYRPTLMHQKETTLLL